MTTITVTRKIQILFDVENRDGLKDLYKKIYEWQRICHKAANWIATHQYLQAEIQNIHYLSEGTKIKLADMKKDADGILTCSRDNTTYQVLSRAFKGECPMGMLSGLNTIVCKTIKEELNDIRLGKKSLRTYRNNIPMPVRKADISNWKQLEDGNFSFFVYGTGFKTRFGRDLSGNKEMLHLAVNGINDYKLCDSSIQIKGNKMFLLAVMQFDKIATELNPDQVLEAELGIECPIIFKLNGYDFTIGGKEEFLHRRMQIQASLRRAQIASRYNKGGKGRAKKMQAIDRFTEAEKNYVTTRLHQYSSKLVDYCVQNKCGKLVLKNQQAKEEEAKSDEQFLLRNWGYFGLREKIEYKCRKYGIELIVE